jgi:hypothetical protein
MRGFCREFPHGCDGDNPLERGGIESLHEATLRSCAGGDVGCCSGVRAAGWRGGWGCAGWERAEWRLGGLPGWRVLRACRVCSAERILAGGVGSLCGRCAGSVWVVPAWSDAGRRVRWSRARLRRWCCGGSIQRPGRAGAGYVGGWSFAGSAGFLPSGVGRWTRRARIWDSLCVC